MRTQLRDTTPSAHFFSLLLSFQKPPFSSSSLPSFLVKTRPPRPPAPPPPLQLPQQPPPPSPRPHLQLLRHATSKLPTTSDELRPPRLTQPNATSSNPTRPSRTSVHLLTLLSHLLLVLVPLTSLAGAAPSSSFISAPPLAREPTTFELLPRSRATTPQAATQPTPASPPSSASFLRRRQPPAARAQPPPAIPLQCSEQPRDLHPELELVRRHPAVAPPHRPPSRRPRRRRRAPRRRPSADQTRALPRPCSLTRTLSSSPRSSPDVSLDLRCLTSSRRRCS